MSEIKDYDKLYKNLDSIRTNVLKMLDNLPQNEITKELRKKLLECKDGVKLIEYTTTIVNMQLVYMNKHSEIYTNK